MMSGDIHSLEMRFKHCPPEKVQTIVEKFGRAVAMFEVSVKGPYQCHTYRRFMLFRVTDFSLDIRGEDLYTLLLLQDLVKSVAAH